MTMPIVALLLSLAFVAGGMYVMSDKFSHIDGVGALALFLLPGLAGVALAIVALIVAAVPASSGWAWLPSVLSYIASVSVVAYAAGVAAIDRLFG